MLLTLTAIQAPAQDLRRPATAESYGWHPGDTLIVIPARVVQVPPFTFAGMKGLRHVRFAEGSHCVKICQHAFAYCEDLETITLPKDFTTFEEGCFRDCYKLRELDIPPGVWELPRSFAQNCESLRRVSLPKWLRNIRAHAFAGCTLLEDITIPPDLREVSNNAFSGCASIRELHFPASVTLIDSYAFSDCTSLERLTLPANMKPLGELIVSGCRNLREISELSRRPPSIECESFLFDPDDAEAYTRCTLRVDPASLELYRRFHAWNLFRNIEPAK